MAELILTDEEREANSWLDLDDASLGRVVKQSALVLAEGQTRAERVMAITCAMMLCIQVAETNADTATIELAGLTRVGVPIGDWTVRLERKSA